VQVEYTLYEDYLVAQNKHQDIYPKYTAHLSDLLLLNRVIKRIVHNDARYLPENPDESLQRAAAREVPGMREHESEQQAAAREEPGVREHESLQRAAAREVPGMREHESE
jgi:hypothetical protein